MQCTLAAGSCRTIYRKKERIESRPNSVSVYHAYCFSYCSLWAGRIHSNNNSLMRNGWMNLHRKAICLIYTFQFEYVCCIRMPSRYMPEWVGFELEVKDMIKKCFRCRRRSGARGWRQHPPINLSVRHDYLAECFFSNEWDLDSADWV